MAISIHFQFRFELLFSKFRILHFCSKKCTSFIKFGGPNSNSLASKNTKSAKYIYYIRWNLYPLFLVNE